MDGVSKQMIRLLIDRCKDEYVRTGLEIALDVICNGGYYNLNDWNELSEKEQWEEVKQYIL